MLRWVSSLWAITLLLPLCACQRDETEPKQLGLPLQTIDPIPLVSADQDPQQSSAVLADYQRVTGISGNLSTAGSDTLANLMTLWSEAFKREYPSVNMQVQAAGSATAPPALAEGTINFGPMSRPFKDNEAEAFELQHGYKPVAIRIAVDAVAVYVHKDNPLKSASLKELDAAFSVTRRCGGTKDLVNWGDFGLDGGWQDRPIALYGRNSVSGTYGYFKSVALCSGDYKSSVNEQPGSASVVQSVASSLNGIGYSGIGYVTSGVKTLTIRRPTGELVPANAQTASDGRYPLSRFFYLYVNKPPNIPLPPIELEFIQFVLSRQGQDIVGKDGYIPLSPAIAARELKKIR